MFASKLNKTALLVLKEVLAVKKGQRVLIITNDKTQVENGGIVQAEVALLDANGNLACADDKTVYYQLVGDGEILGIENGCPDDLTCYAEKFRSTYRRKTNKV